MNRRGRRRRRRPPPPASSCSSPTPLWSPASVSTAALCFRPPAAGSPSPAPPLCRPSLPAALLPSPRTRSLCR
ncbi:unnamed protein product [Spirodela intermedia]|uniref:Uncharacterized protein n=1 Tax=Spirodela intermedia TaxID=51605 RepID=A0A7I8J248_SPIIN|nr:unnamed protein product [Spirodela intermedia]CAA6664139.1 unnamed protein product [Spirodela intermedia]